MNKAFEFSDARACILGELEKSLGAIDDAQSREVMNALIGARKVFVVGVGRVMLMLQAFVKRLNHLGIEAFYVGEINEPAITADDVLLTASGSGESAVPVAITKIAAKYGAKIIYVGSNLSSTVAGMSDLQLRIPCKTKLNLSDELPSAQPMSSLFEQSLLLALDCIAFMIVREKNLVMSELWQTHANLE